MNLPLIAPRIISRYTKISEEHVSEDDLTITKTSPIEKWQWNWQHSKSEKWACKYNELQFAIQN